MKFSTTCALALLVLLAPGVLGASQPTQDWQMRSSWGQVYQTYTDERILDENRNATYSYITSTYSTYQLSTRWRNYFDDDFSAFISLLNHEGASATASGVQYLIPARFTAFFHIAIIKSLKNVDILYGSTSLLTLRQYAKRRLELASNTEQSSPEKMVIDTNLSQPYPALGIYLFPHERVGFNAGFLDHNSNLVQGWLNTSVWLKLAEHSKFEIGTELLNEDNFDGIISFIKSATAVFGRYNYQNNSLSLVSKIGLVLNPSQQDESGIISMGDRFYGELGMGVRL